MKMDEYLKKKNEIQDKQKGLQDRMSELEEARKKAKEIISLEKLQNNLKEKNIVLNASSSKGTLEEAPEVYKDVDEVVRTSHEIGIGKKVAKLIPLAVLIGN